MPPSFSNKGKCTPQEKLLEVSNQSETSYDLGFLSNYIKTTDQIKEADVKEQVEWIGWKG